MSVRLLSEASTCRRWRPTMSNLDLLELTSTAASSGARCAGRDCQFLCGLTQHAQHARQYRHHAGPFTGWNNNTAGIVVASMNHEASPQVQRL